MIALKKNKILKLQWIGARLIISKPKNFCSKCNKTDGIMKEKRKRNMAMKVHNEKE